eukprot:gene124-117_t
MVVRYAKKGEPCWVDASKAEAFIYYKPFTRLSSGEVEGRLLLRVSAAARGSDAGDFHFSVGDRQFGCDFCLCWKTAPLPFAAPGELAGSALGEPVVAQAAVAGAAARIQAEIDGSRAAEISEGVFSRWIQPHGDARVVARVTSSRRRARDAPPNSTAAQVASSCGREASDRSGGGGADDARAGRSEAVAATGGAAVENSEEGRHDTALNRAVAADRERSGPGPAASDVDSSRSIGRSSRAPGRARSACRRRAGSMNPSTTDATDLTRASLTSVEISTDAAEASRHADPTHYAYKTSPEEFQQFLDLFTSHPKYDQGATQNRRELEAGTAARDSVVFECELRHSKTDKKFWVEKLEMQVLTRGKSKWSPAQYGSDRFLKIRFVGDSTRPPMRFGLLGLEYHILTPEKSSRMSVYFAERAAPSNSGNGMTAEVLRQGSGGSPVRGDSRLTLSAFAGLSSIAAMSSQDGRSLMASDDVASLFGARLAEPPRLRELTICAYLRKLYVTDQALREVIAKKKLLKRAELGQSDTFPGATFDESEIHLMPDARNHGGVVMTDGCGFIAYDFARKQQRAIVERHFPRATKAQRENVPDDQQARTKSDKGMLKVVNADYCEQVGFKGLALVESQRKFTVDWRKCTAEDRRVMVMAFTDPAADDSPTQHHLSDEVILLLQSLASREGRGREFADFIRGLQKEKYDQMEADFRDTTAAGKVWARLEERHAWDDDDAYIFFRERVCEGFGFDCSLPEVTRVAAAVVYHKHALKGAGERSGFEMEGVHCAWALPDGVPVPDGNGNKWKVGGFILRNEREAIYRQPSGEYLAGDALVCRAPCNLSSDIQRVTFLSEEEVRSRSNGHLPHFGHRGAMVFAANPEAKFSFLGELSNGDYDGDLVTAIFVKEIVELCKTREPSDCQMVKALQQLPRQTQQAGCASGGRSGSHAGIRGLFGRGGTVSDEELQNAVWEEYARIFENAIKFYEPYVAARDRGLAWDHVSRDADLQAEGYAFLHQLTLDKELTAGLERAVKDKCGLPAKEGSVIPCWRYDHIEKESTRHFKTSIPGNCVLADLNSNAKTMAQGKFWEISLGMPLDDFVSHLELPLAEKLRIPRGLDAGLRAQVADIIEKCGRKNKQKWRAKMGGEHMPPQLDCDWDAVCVEKLRELHFAAGRDRAAIAFAALECVLRLAAKETREKLHTLRRQEGGEKVQYPVSRVKIITRLSYLLRMPFLTGFGPDIHDLLLVRSAAGGMTDPADVVFTFQDRKCTAAILRARCWDAMWRSIELQGDLASEDLAFMRAMLAQHPDAEEKLRGLATVRVGAHPTKECRCFLAVYADGSEDSFSVRKIIEHLEGLKSGANEPALPRLGAGDVGAVSEGEPCHRAEDGGHVEAEQQLPEPGLRRRLGDGNGDGRRQASDADAESVGGAEVHAHAARAEKCRRGLSWRDAVLLIAGGLSWHIATSNKMATNTDWGADRLSRGTLLFGKGPLGRIADVFLDPIFLINLISTVDAADGALFHASFKQMERQFHYTPSNLGFLSTCQGLAYSISLPIWAALLPKRGCRDLLMVCCGAWGITTMFTPICSPFVLQCILRAFNGAALAGVMPIAQTIVAEEVRESGRGFAFGKMTALHVLAKCAVSYRVISLGRDWAEIYFILTLVTAFLMLLIMAALPRNYGKEDEIYQYRRVCESVACNQSFAFGGVSLQVGENHNAGGMGVDSVASVASMQSMGGLAGMGAGMGGSFAISPGRRAGDRHGGGGADDDLECSPRNAQADQMELQDPNDIAANPLGDTQFADMSGKPAANNNPNVLQNQGGGSIFETDGKLQNVNVRPVAAQSLQHDSPKKTQVAAQSLQHWVADNLLIMRKIVQIPSFLVLIVQGIVGSIPWQAMAFLNMYWAALGFSDEHCARISAITHLGGVIGALFGGWFGDCMARRHSRNYGRILVAQISILFGIPLWNILLNMQLVRANTDHVDLDSGVGMYSAITVGFMFYAVATWVPNSSNRPICAELVSSPAERAQIVSSWVLVEGALSSMVGPPIVGMLSERFGYKFVPGQNTELHHKEHVVVNNQKSKEMLTELGQFKQGVPTSSANSFGDLDSAAALSDALRGIGGVCWWLCFILWFVMYYTLPRDKRRMRMERRDVRREWRQLHKQDLAERSEGQPNAPTQFNAKPQVVEMGVIGAGRGDNDGNTATNTGVAGGAGGAPAAGGGANKFGAGGGFLGAPQSVGRSVFDASNPLE